MKLLSRSRRAVARLPIRPRRMNFRFQGFEQNRYWFDNDPVLTHFMNVLSVTFPDGERFFVDAVRAFRDQVDDPQRQKDISGFIGQEAMHSLEHKAFNDLVAGHGEGYDALVGEALGVAQRLLAGARKHLSAERQLAATAGLEHITAILADTILRRADMVEKMDPSVRPLWVWHAIEETEHKAVAFDLYQDVSGDYWQRQRAFFYGTAYLTVFSAYFTWRFLKEDGVHRRPLTLAKGLWKMFGYSFGHKGVVTQAIPAWFQYLRPGFHPWQDDNSHLLEQWRDTLPEPAVTAAA
ncbi:metal-dependent hydrolase [Alloalcanivorax profundimaris]|uniref:metal-dependent hydrolase n=1 Tax=Alloalcanivorax profundimaris TaxID=2735259 RepID=UPI00136978AD|nr:metal-dependent hydrolase [Alloalcanivorax profundimaris]MBF1802111.1 metal-dependent hydrolase [Alloalcanivorax profundimaris]MBM1143675.1 metal-dependent hydrolase [Alcanivorax sp. ZXX171]MCQ6261128.1 metal-dependent hydrolase [Alcanivorax sp. MM125-6]